MGGIPKARPRRRLRRHSRLRENRPDEGDAQIVGKYAPHFIALWSHMHSTTSALAKDADEEGNGSLCRRLENLVVVIRHLEERDKRFMKRKFTQEECNDEDLGGTARTIAVLRAIFTGARSIEFYPERRQAGLALTYLYDKIVLARPDFLEVPVLERHTHHWSKPESRVKAFYDLCVHFWSSSNGSYQTQQKKARGKWIRENALDVCVKSLKAAQYAPADSLSITAYDAMRALLHILRWFHRRERFKIRSCAQRSWTTEMPRLRMESRSIATASRKGPFDRRETRPASGGLQTWPQVTTTESLETRFARFGEGSRRWTCQSSLGQFATAQLCKKTRTNW